LKILILGSNGMLGHMVNSVLIKEKFDVFVTKRHKLSSQNQPTVDLDFSDLGNPNSLKKISNFDFIVNCVGVIKPRIKENDSESVLNAININSYLPHLIQNRISQSSTNVIQIATDCVYSGSHGPYLEKSLHDANDVYGKTKSLGEVNSPNFMNLRCSIIGPELNSKSSLLEWVINQPAETHLNGFVDHVWNGITTLAFAKIVSGIITSSFSPGTFHVIPKSPLTKYELVNEIAINFGRHDLLVKKTNSENPIDRSLSTSFPDFNLSLWRSAGYNHLPKIQDLIKELKEWRF
jgi:dTDP-4-dehydrorhamnose reductase